MPRLGGQPFCSRSDSQTLKLYPASEPRFTQSLRGSWQCSETGHLVLERQVLLARFAEGLEKGAYGGPAGYAKETARCKAIDVANSLHTQGRRPDLIIGADTVRLVAQACFMSSCFFTTKSLLLRSLVSRVLRLWRLMTWSWRNQAAMQMHLAC